MQCRAPDLTLPHGTVDDEPAWYRSRRRTLTIRDEQTHRAVALVLTVTPGDKRTARAWREFVDRTTAMQSAGLHLLILDLFPPPPDEPDADRTLVAYSAGPLKTAYIEPVAVGQLLRDMPLFLTPDGESHVAVPVESTYMAAYSFLGEFYRDILNPTVNT